jgi:hypothetical protein
MVMAAELAISIPEEAAMSAGLEAALVAAVTSLLVAVVTPWSLRAVEVRRQARTVADEVNLRHLAPLRQQLAETVYRHHDLLDRIRRQETDVLSYLTDVEDLPDKPWSWFARHGSYLMSTAYYTAALFAELARLRDAYPFLRLRDRAMDAELTALVLRVHLAFRGEHGVYYAVQHAIGQDMLDNHGRVRVYSDFCRATQDADRGVWYQSLIRLYMGATEPPVTAVITQATSAMESLASLLDTAVGATASVTSRLRIEAEAHNPTTQ